MFSPVPLGRLHSRVEMVSAAPSAHPAGPAGISLFRSLARSAAPTLSPTRRRTALGEIGGPRCETQCGRKPVRLLTEIRTATAAPAASAKAMTGRAPETVTIPPARGTSRRAPARTPGLAGCRVQLLQRGSRLHPVGVIQPGHEEDRQDSRELGRRSTSVGTAHAAKARGMLRRWRAALLARSE